MALSLGAALLGSSIIGGGLSFLGSQQAAGTQANASLQAAQTQLMGLAMAQQFQREQTDQALGKNQEGIAAYNQYVPNTLDALAQGRGALAGGLQNSTNALTNNVNNAISTSSNFRQLGSPEFQCRLWQCAKRAANRTGLSERRDQRCAWPGEWRPRDGGLWSLRRGQ
jgi:post-segregation antitoxin (ccd killing protein)